MVVFVGCPKRSHRLLANSSYRSGSKKLLPKPSCPIKRNLEAGFLEHLRILRNRAVDDALFQYHRDKDPMCAKLPNSTRYGKLQELPECVAINFSAMTYKGTSTPAQEVVLRMDLCTRNRCRVERSRITVTALIYSDNPIWAALG